MQLQALEGFCGTLASVAGKVKCAALLYGGKRRDIASNESLPRMHHPNATSVRRTRSRIYSSAARIRASLTKTCANLIPPMESADLTLVLGALQQCLKNEESTESAPRGLDIALENLSSNDELFLNAGFVPWYAYFRATRDSSVKESLAKLSSQDLEKVAATISKIKPHPSIARRIQSFLYSSHRGRKRARKSSRLLSMLSTNPLRTVGGRQSTKEHPQP